MCALAPRTTIAVGVALDDAQVHVGVVLLGRALAAVALDVGHRGGRHDLVALEAADVGDDALVVGRAVTAVDVDRRDHQRLQLVAADARVAAQRRALGQQLRCLEVLEQILRRSSPCARRRGSPRRSGRGSRSSSLRSRDRTPPGTASCPTRSASARTPGAWRDPRALRASGSRPCEGRAAWTVPRVCRAPSRLLSVRGQQRADSAATAASADAQSARRSTLPVEPRGR